MDSTTATALDHSSAFVDGIVTSATDANSNTITSHENQSGYFLKSAVSSITNNQVKNLGYIALIKNGASTASNTLTLKPGTTYSLSFFARAKYPWHNFVSNGSNSENASTHGDRVPFIEIYSATAAKTENSVTTTGLYLQPAEDMTPVSTQGRAVNNHIWHNFVDNKDLETYISQHTYDLHPIQKEIIKHNEHLGAIKKMQISVTQGYFFQFFEVVIFGDWMVEGVVDCIDIKHNFLVKIFLKSLEIF